METPKGSLNAAISTLNSSVCSDESRDGVQNPGAVGRSSAIPASQQESLRGEIVVCAERELRRAATEFAQTDIEVRPLRGQLRYQENRSVARQRSARPP